METAIRQEDKARAWLAKVEQVRAEIAQALEGLDDGDCHFVLYGLLWNGWRRPNGEWRDVHNAR